MPTSVGPNTFGEENLVFGYDLGDVVNSYKGEPTTNVIANPEPLSGWGVSNYLTSTATITYSSDNGIPHLELSNVNVDSGYPRINMANLTSTITDGFSMSFEAKSNIAGTQVGLALYSNGSTKTTQYTTLTTQWQRFKFENLSTGFTLDDGYLRVPSTTSGAVYYIRRIQVEQKTHATPFTTGTRSATQGLKDLTGNSTIDLTNVSFDSNAQMTFDGTNDKIHGVSTTLSYLSSSAFEFVVTPESTGVRMMIGGYRHNQGYSSPTIGAVYIDTDNKFKASVITAAEVYRYAESTTTTSANRTYHVVFNKDTVTGVMQLYINGTLESTTTFNAATYGQWSSAGNYIGSNNLDFGKSFNTDSGQGWGSDFLDGKIQSIKLYSRTLTASEVASNYKAIKGRFNI